METKSTERHLSLPLFIYLLMFARFHFSSLPVNGNEKRFLSLRTWLLPGAEGDTLSTVLGIVRLLQGMSQADIFKKNHNF